MTPRGGATCNDPARSRLEELWQSHGSWHESLFQLVSMRGLADTLADIPQDFVAVKRQALGADRCPFGRASEAELAAYRQEAQGRLTLCPAHDVVNYDENRVPATLFEKRCSCQRCGFTGTSGEKSLVGAGAGGGGGGGGRRHSGVSTLGCKPQLYYAKVLRRVRCGEDHVFVYQPVLEPLVVGCTCDHQTRHSKHRHGKRLHTRQHKK